MLYQPTTNFKDSDGVDLGKKLITKEYLLEVYGSILDSIGNSNLSVTPELWVWGRNNFGQLGINNSLARSTPVTTFAGGINWKSIAIGNAHTAAIKTDGTLWTWGYNGYGNLGVNDTTNRNTPVTTILGGNTWKQVDCSSNSIAAIKTDGTLWNWGRSGSGILGIDDSLNDRLTPVTTILGGTDWRQVSCGYVNMAAIKTNGTLWIWGDGSFGQTGVNDGANRLTPVTTLAGGTNWKQVSLGYKQVYAIKTDGTLWSWGRDSVSDLGQGSVNISRSTPSTVWGGGSGNWKRVAAGKFSAHGTAIKTDGTLWTWGLNTLGQLGVNDRTDRRTPVTTILGGTNWKTSYSAVGGSAAIKTDGTLWVWGRGSFAELGTNNTTSRSTPVTTILGGNNWKFFAGGDGQNMAIRTINDI